MHLKSGTGIRSGMDKHEFRPPRIRLTPSRTGANPPWAAFADPRSSGRKTRAVERVLNGM